MTMTNSSKLREALQEIRNVCANGLKTYPPEHMDNAVRDTIYLCDQALSQPPTETPVTDYAVYYVSEEAHRLIFGEDGELCGEVVNAEVSRRLERTLHAKERELAATRSDRDDWRQNYPYETFTHLQHELAEAKEQLATLQSVSAAGAEQVWDRFIAHLNSMSGYDNKNFIGSVLKYKRIFLESFPVTSPAAPQEGKADEHPHTEACGFDRNASHREDTYVCACGWRAPQPATTRGDGKSAMQRFNDMRESFSEYESDGNMYSKLRSLYFQVAQELDELRAAPSPPSKAEGE